MQTLCIIPARAGSKGVKRKAERNVGGTSLLVRTIRKVSESTSIDDIVVSTDDQNYATLARENGVKVPFLRPSHIAQDNSSIIDVIDHELHNKKIQGTGEYEYLLLAQPTSPFVESVDFDNSFGHFDSGVDAVVSVCLSDVYPDWLRVIDDNGWVQPLGLISMHKNHTPRQNLRQVYRINGAIYWIKIEAFNRYRTLLPKNTRPYKMPVQRSLDIDNEFDLQLANWLDKKATYEEQNISNR